MRIMPDTSMGVKKRYAYVDYDGKHGYRGVEMRRSSTPQVVKTCQKKLFESILNGDSRTLPKSTK